MGYFIPPNNYWALMQPIMEDFSHQGHIRVLASLMSGANISQLTDFLPTVLSFLQQPSISHSREVFILKILVWGCGTIEVV